MLTLAQWIEAVRTSTLYSLHELPDADVCAIALMCMLSEQAGNQPSIMAMAKAYYNVGEARL